MSKGGGSAPPPRDTATAAANEAAADRVTQFRPDGSLAIEYGHMDGDNFVTGASDRAELPQAAVKLHESPYEAAIRTASEGTGEALATSLANDAQNFGPAPTLADFDSQTYAQQIYDASTQRAREDSDHAFNRVTSNLQARGLAPGSEAYNRVMKDVVRGEQDAYLRAGHAGWLKLSAARGLTSSRGLLVEVIHRARSTFLYSRVRSTQRRSRNRITRSRWPLITPIRTDPART